MRIAPLHPEETAMRPTIISVVAHSGRFQVTGRLRRISRHKKYVRALYRSVREMKQAYGIE